MTRPHTTYYTMDYILLYIGGRKTQYQYNNVKILQVKYLHSKSYLSKITEVLTAELTGSIKSTHCAEK